MLVGHEPIPADSNPLGRYTVTPRCPCTSAMYLYVAMAATWLSKALGCHHCETMIRYYWKCGRVWYRIFPYLWNCRNRAHMNTPEVIAALAALAQESRLAVFRLLIQAGPEGLAASKIGECLGLAPSSLSFHLKELTHARLASSRQDGRFVIYKAEIATMNELVGFLTENCCGGVPCAAIESCEAVRC